LLTVAAHERPQSRDRDATGESSAAALSRLAREGKFEVARAKAAFVELGVDTERANPAQA
jgi:hypothetical protein